MHDLVYELKQLGWRNKDGSNATWADRRALLMLCGEQLVELGYKDLRIDGLGGRHVVALVKKWKEKDKLSPGTLANRMAALRYWASKVNRSYVVAKTNEAYGIVPRERVPTVSKAQEMSEDILARVIDPYIWHSLNLQRAWGLRRSESLLLKPHKADGGERLLLQGSWCKNGRPREVVLRTPRQREALDAAKAFVLSPDASLIPSQLTFIQQRKKYDYWVQKLGLSKLHGLRHAFAADMYRDLTGMEPPIAGGPRYADMSSQQQEASTTAREIISEMLGHGRIAITSVYLGSDN